MGDADERPSRDGRAGRTARRLGRGGTGLAVLLLVAAFVAQALDLGHRWGVAAPDPQTDPAAVAPPPGLHLPGPAAAPAVAPSLDGGRLDPAAVRRALGGLTRSPRLGTQVSVLVAGVDGRPVHTEGPRLVTPASTLKPLTCLAALKTLGPEHRFTTSVVRRGGQVVLVGGGDPLLTERDRGDYPHEADLTTLARQTAQALQKRHRTHVRLGYDDSLFTGPSVNPFWEPDYVPTDVVSPITALWVDEARAKGGFGYSSDPAGDAGQVFAQTLRRQGIEVVGKVIPTTAPSAAAGGRTLSSVRGAPLAEVAQHVLEVSDNEGAEVLAHQVAVAEGRPATFSGGAAAVRSVLRRLGIDTTGDLVYDGSGLSRDDRLAPSTLLRVLAADSSPAHPELRPVVAGLPVAGFTGSLKYRFDKGDPGGLGTVRAKTGTLTGVHGLAGSATSRDGVVMLFVVVADRVKPVNSLDARQLVDRMAAALGGCACAATP